MRQDKAKSRQRQHNRIPRMARELKITNEEILGDLLYPAPP